MKLAKIIFSVICMSQAANAQEAEGVLIRCGASSGHSFFFKDDTFNPKGSGWTKDGISTGKIVLVKLGEEWDIQFDDITGASGYRQDGATVVLLSGKPTMLTVGAFHSNYADIYTFDFEERIVAWSSNKSGPFAAKVSVYKATCE